jgi:hypothetical protein
MEPSILAALISAFVASIGVVFGYSQWRRDVKIKLGQIREEVSVELIRQRIEPYAEFMKDLEALSSLHLDEVQAHPEKMFAGMQVLQDAVYGKVGLLTSHSTRQVLLYVRAGCKHFVEGKITKGELTARLWALHFALRSDLGIAQPEWPSEVERIHADALRDEGQSFESLIKGYPWHKVDLEMRHPNRDMNKSQQLK